jgi:ribosomal protein S18 acetylase RimI-like enzyme
MAASLVQPADYRVVDLREFRADDLKALLDEQTAYWNTSFLWDFIPSRDVIRRFLDSRSLYGLALVREGRPIGYSYFVPEDRKGLVGDLFVTSVHRSQQAERFLLHNIIKNAAVFPGVRRIEGQLLALACSPDDETIFGRPLAVFERSFMVLDQLEGQSVERQVPTAIRFQNWSDAYLDSAADLIAVSYLDHVDSRINDQYRSYAGARRFIYNTTQHPGCGVFFRQAAMIAIDPLSERLCGLCLGSLVQPTVGHITQLSVAPEARGRGVGFELLRRSMEAFRAHGCSAVSLTVTSSNRSAIELYHQVGFQTARKFSAFVWEAF